MYRNELNSLQTDLLLCRKYVAGLPNPNVKVVAFLDAALVQCYRTNYTTEDETYLTVKTKTADIRLAIHNHSLSVVEAGMASSTAIEVA